MADHSANNEPPVTAVEPASITEIARLVVAALVTLGVFEFDDATWNTITLIIGGILSIVFDLVGPTEGHPDREAAQQPGRAVGAGPAGEEPRRRAAVPTVTAWQGCRVTVDARPPRVGTSVAVAGRRGSLIGNG